MASNLQIKPLFIFGFGTSEDKVGTSECNQIQQVFKEQEDVGFILSLPAMINTLKSTRCYQNREPNHMPVTQTEQLQRSHSFLQQRSFFFLAPFRAF